MIVNNRANAALTWPRLLRNLKSTGSPNTIAGGSMPVMAAALAAVCVFALWQAPLLHAQGHRSKVPIVGKLTSPNGRQAYSGKIRSLDLKQKILNIDSLDGQQSEIFPIKKNVRVESLNGNRMNLKALKPGTSVLIYFNQKSGERNIRNIIVLSSAKEQAKAKQAPSS